jgi:beta-glucosidase-like glycosyl hydrolase
MRRAVALISLFVLAGCGSRVVATSPSVTPKATAESAAAASTSAAAGSGNQDAILGPAGMTLQQEIGAVMMVGFTGPLTPAVLEDWRQHQYGGLIVVPVNTSDAAATRQLIEAIRGVMLHPLLAATNPEGAPGQTQPATTSRGLKAVGFDINFAAGPDVHDLAASVADVHAAGMYAAARQSTDVAAVIAAHAEFVVVGHLTVPSIAVPRNLGYQGVIISDDLQLGSLSPGNPPPAAAVRFLKNGGDMVIVAHDITVANATYVAIHNAVLNGSYPRRQLDASVQKLLSLSLRYMP